MSSEVIKSLYRYNIWVTEKLLTVAEAAAIEEWQGTHTGGRGSLRDTFVHEMTTHFNWMNYWDGTKPVDAQRIPFDPAEFPDVAASRALWEKVKLKSNIFVDQLDEVQSNAVHSLAAPGERESSMTLWQMMTQVATHTVQHNSEMAEALSALGHSPGDLDYLFFILGDQY